MCRRNDEFCEITFVEIQGICFRIKMGSEEEEKEDIDKNEYHCIHDCGI